MAQQQQVRLARLRLSTARRLLARFTVHRQGLGSLDRWYGPRTQQQSWWIQCGLIVGYFPFYVYPLYIYSLGPTLLRFLISLWARLPAVMIDPEVPFVSLVHRVWSCRVLSLNCPRHCSCHCFNLVLCRVRAEYLSVTSPESSLELCTESSAWPGSSMTNREKCRDTKDMTFESLIPRLSHEQHLSP